MSLIIINFNGVNKLSTEAGGNFDTWHAKL